MEALGWVLRRLVTLTVMVAVSELALPGGNLKQCVRLIGGILVAQAMLELIWAIPAAFGLQGR